MTARFPSNIFVGRSQYSLRAAASALTVCVLGALPVYGQGSTVRHSESRVAHPPPFFVHASAVRVYVAPSADASGQREIPPNLQVSKLLKSTVETMLLQSPTFRRQCARLESARSAAISLHSYQPMPSEPPARTIFIRNGDRLSADIAIAPIGKTVELVAHEIEHVIEQLDGVDLRAHVSRRGAASMCQDGSFETVRAIRQGRLVAQEVEGAR